MLPSRSMSTYRAMRMTSGRAWRNSGDSLRLPGADTNGAITVQLRSQKATTFQPTRRVNLRSRCEPPGGVRHIARLIKLTRCAANVESRSDRRLSGAHPIGIMKARRRLSEASWRILRPISVTRPG
jgi:hypothetical protein